MNEPAHGKSGMARCEWLFVFSILLLISCFCLPAFLSWQKHNRVRRTYTDIRVLVSAAQQYQREYREWPDAGDATGDQRFGFKIPNARIIGILRAIEGPGNENHSANRNRIDFIAMKAIAGTFPAIDVAGNAVDPWRSPYQLVLDGNYDAACSIPDSAYQEITGEDVVVWSYGPDRRSDTEDDLRSWLR